MLSKWWGTCVKVTHNYPEGSFMIESDLDSTAQDSPVKRMSSNYIALYSSLIYSSLNDFKSFKA